MDFTLGRIEHAAIELGELQSRGFRGVGIRLRERRDRVQRVEHQVWVHLRGELRELSPKHFVFGVFGAELGGALGVTELVDESPNADESEKTKRSRCQDGFTDDRAGCVGTEYAQRNR